MDEMSVKGHAVQVLAIGHGGKDMVTANDATVGTPLWVKVQGAMVLLLILVVVAMSTGLTGGHGHDDTRPGDETHTRGHP
jgi:hypothetical protein